MSKKKVLSKFTTLCWATFIVILGCMWPAGCRLDTSMSNYFAKVSPPKTQNPHFIHKATSSVCGGFVQMRTRYPL